MKFSLSWTKVSHWLTVAGATFAGAAAGYGEANLVKLTTGQWKLVAGGAVLAGIMAVAHLGLIPKDEKSNTSEIKS